MKPTDFVTFWDVLADGDCIAHFRQEDKAIAFMMTYGDDTWLCLERTMFFCDAIDPEQVFEDIMVEIEGEWRHFTEFGPQYGGAS